VPYPTPPIRLFGPERDEGHRAQRHIAAGPSPPESQARATAGDIASPRHAGPPRSGSGSVLSWRASGLYGTRLSRWLMMFSRPRFLSSVCAIYRDVQATSSPCRTRISRPRPPVRRCRVSLARRSEPVPHLALGGCSDERVRSRRRHGSHPLMGDPTARAHEVSSKRRGRDRDEQG
jgi:hypothetical protein